MILFVDEEEIDKQINFTLPRERLSIHFSPHSPLRMRFRCGNFSLFFQFKFGFLLIAVKWVEALERNFK